MTTSEQASAVPAPPCVAQPEAEKWFKAEVLPHDGQLKNYLRGQFRTVRDVEDVVQESYLKVWQARTLRPINSAKAYLFSVARHLALNLIRSEKRSPVDFTGDQALDGVFEERTCGVAALTEQEKLELLTDALADLPSRVRTILLLHKIDGLSQAETAHKLGLTEKAVAHHVARGVQRCAEFIRRRHEA